MIDLTPFCDPTRPAIAYPFLQGGYVYAINGKIGLRMPADTPFSRPEDAPPPPKMANVWTEPSSTAVWLPLADITDLFGTPAKCEACEGEKHIRRCPVCDGEGDVECNLGHMHECTTCRGSGKFPCSPQAGSEPCGKCKGAGSVATWKKFRVANGDNRVLSGDLLSLALKLPNVELAIEASSKAVVHFRFAGGDGLMMVIWSVKDVDELPVAAEAVQHD